MNLAAWNSDLYWLGKINCTCTNGIMQTSIVREEALWCLFFFFAVVKSSFPVLLLCQRAQTSFSSFSLCLLYSHAKLKTSKNSTVMNYNYDWGFGKLCIIVGFRFLLFYIKVVITTSVNMSPIALHCKLHMLSNPNLTYMLGFRDLKPASFNVLNDFQNIHSILCTATTVCCNRLYIVSCMF